MNKNFLPKINTLFFKQIARNIVLKLNAFLDILIPIKCKKYDSEKIALLDYSGIGDFLLNAYYINEYLKHFSNKKISLIVSDLVYPIANHFFNQYDFVTIYPINIRRFEYNFLYRRQILSKIGCQSKLYSIHPNFDYNNYIIYSKILSKSYIRYEGEPSFYNIISTNKKNEKIIKNPFGNKNVNIVNHFYIIFKNNISENPIFEPSEKKIIDFFKSIEYPLTSFSLKEPYIVILTDSSSSYRTYPIQQWQELLNLIPDHINIVQLGKNSFPLVHKNLISLIDKTSLIESMSIIKKAKFVIGNETGLSHFAYLNNIQTAVILGGGHYKRFLPSFLDFNVIYLIHKMECFECGWRCNQVKNASYDQVPCITNISPLYIFEILKQNGAFK